jgi:hypothetical protein
VGLKGHRHTRRTSLVVQSGHGAALTFSIGLAQGVEDVGHAALLLCSDGFAV